VHSITERIEISHVLFKGGQGASWPDDLPCDVLYVPRRRGCAMPRPLITIDQHAEQETAFQRKLSYANIESISTDTKHLKGAKE
jgi:hypothetical protein